jgi:RNA methyltransferase, TrmH family
MYYPITSPQNQKVKHWKKLQTKKGRSLHQAYLIEGIHLILEAKKADACIQAIVVSETFADSDGVVATYASSVPVYELPQPLFAQLSETEQTQGVLAELKLPEWDIQEQIAVGETYLLLDAVQDPGNLGTILRTAWAAGVGMVVLGKGTVDRFNSKVIRSTMGALFYLPVVEASLRELLPTLKSEGIEVIGTSPHNGIYSYDYRFPKRVALVLGNEGRGIAPELQAQLDQAIMVPMLGDAESYNVSVTTAMVLYEYIRQKLVKRT